MRTFYIFKINKEMSILLKENPYNLFRSLEGIYYMDIVNASFGKDLLDDIIVPIDKTKYNQLIYDKYRNEDTNIIVKNSHILLKTNIINKDIRKFLPITGLFACDFENKDYFWLEQLVRL